MNQSSRSAVALSPSPARRTRRGLSLAAMLSVCALSGVGLTVVAASAWDSGSDAGAAREEGERTVITYSLPDETADLLGRLLSLEGVIDQLRVSEARAAGLAIEATPQQHEAIADFIALIDPTFRAAREKEQRGAGGSAMNNSFAADLERQLEMSRRMLVTQAEQLEKQAAEHDRKAAELDRKAASARDMERTQLDMQAKMLHGQADQLRNQAASLRDQIADLEREHREKVMDAQRQANGSNRRSVFDSDSDSASDFQSSSDSDSESDTDSDSDSDSDSQTSSDSQRSSDSQSSKKKSSDRQSSSSSSSQSQSSKSSDSDSQSDSDSDSDSSSSGGR